MTFRKKLFEKDVVKWENACKRNVGNQHFLLFAQCFTTTRLANNTSKQNGFSIPDQIVLRVNHCD